MKKILTLILSIALCFCALLSGCSCNPTQYLEFNSNFAGGETLNVGYEETLTYSAKYVNDESLYPTLTKPSSADGLFKDDGIKYEGTYVMNFKVLAPSQVSLPEGVSSDIFDKIASEKIEQVYSLKTKMQLTATYQFEGEDQPTIANDKIETLVYFLPEGQSFAPIYSTYLSDVSILSARSNEHLLRTTYDFKTIYNQDEFIMDTVIKVLDQNGEAEDDPITDHVEKGYTFRTDIDNNTLLFALRNLKTNSENSTNLSVISAGYKSYKSLSISKHTTEIVSIGFASVTENEKLPVKKFSFCVDDKNASGQYQYVTIQTQSSTPDKTVANNSLLVSFAQPIYDYSLMSCVGAIEFSLISVE